MASKTLLNKTVCIVGLGYVGLPLAQDFYEHIRTIGCRCDQKKVDELNKNTWKQNRGNNRPEK
ncbi:MAG: hypothetical protein NTW33_01665 [Methanoregula sp.]|nr:hypothetical protein [Methanoregula sp.]